MGHVVGVHHTVHEADPHPCDHQCRGAPADFLEPREVDRPRALQRAVGGQVETAEIRADGVVEQALERIEVTACGVDLEVSETRERRGHAAHHCARLRARVAVVEHVANDALAGRYQRQRAGRRYTEMVHRFAAQELAYARAQHGQAVGAARVGRGAGTLELQRPAFVAPVDDLAQIDRAAVAELACPVAELVAAVARGIGVHAGEQPIAGEDPR